MNPVDLRVCGMIDPEHIRDRDVASLAVRTVEGGGTLIHLASEGANGRRLVDGARAIKDALEHTGVPFLVHGRIDVALAAVADGVHLGQGDMHPVDARRLMGPRAIIGLTISTPEQADEMYRLPVDYAWIGGVFASLDGHTPPLGLEGFSRIAFRARLASGCPVGAVGGVDTTNAAAAVAAGADGIGVASTLFAAEHPETAAGRFRAILDHTLAARGSM